MQIEMLCDTLPPRLVMIRGCEYTRVKLATVYRFIQVISSYRWLFAASRERHGPGEGRALGESSSNEAVYAAWKNEVLTRT